jgi:hypothetical protein
MSYRSPRVDHGDDEIETVPATPNKCGPTGQAKLAPATDTRSLGRTGSLGTRPVR